MITPEEALPGRDTAITINPTHAVLGSDMTMEAGGYGEVLLGLGCFWGAERVLYQLDGVVCTAVGYAGGFTPNPTYEEVCTSHTGHSEVVRVIFDREILSFEQLLKVFFEKHDPSQSMRQGNDIGTQYRSAIYVFNSADAEVAERVKATYGESLAKSGLGAPTTEIAKDQTFYFAEEYHQQYLHKNPAGYCGIGGTGVSCPI